MHADVHTATGKIVSCITFLIPSLDTQLRGVQMKLHFSNLKCVVICVRF